MRRSAARRIPFVLTSGYADWHMPDEWHDRPRLQKPYTIDEVEQALERLLRLAYIILLVVEPPIVWSPPVTDPPDAICCCTAWVSCGDVVVALQLA